MAAKDGTRNPASLGVLCARPPGSEWRAYVQGPLFGQAKSRAPLALSRAVGEPLMRSLSYG